MADLYNYIPLTGTIVPDTGDILTAVQNEFKLIFGSDLDVSPTTPQGAMIVSESLARKAVIDNNAVLANQINPNLSGGIFLDAIGQLTGIQRTPKQYTEVPINITGIAGTNILQGALVYSPSINVTFQTLTNVTIGSDGMASVVVASMIAGAITVEVNTIINIISNVLGWETVTNPTIQSSLGAETQSDISFKNYRIETLATQGSSLSEAITSALAAVVGVTSFSYRENISPSTQVIDGITMIGHSIYACVNGGANTDVANALNSKKSGGAAYNNGASTSPQSINVTDSYSGQIIAVLFDRPEVIQILVRATVQNNSSISDLRDSVIKAILDYQSGLIPGNLGLQVGVPVSCFALAGAVGYEIPGLFVINMEISLISPISYSNAEIPIELWQVAQIQSTSITVVIV